MTGGLAPTSSWFTASAKTYRAPTEQERQLKRNARLMTENENRKIKDLKQTVKAIQDQRQVESRLARYDTMARRVETSPSGFGLSPRGFAGLRRSSSFAGFGGGKYGGVKSGLAQLQAEKDFHQRERLAEAEKDQLRAKLRNQEEMLRRQRTISAMEQQRQINGARYAAAAFSNQQAIVQSARLGVNAGLGAGLIAGQRPRRASFSSVPLIRPVITTSPYGHSLDSPHFGVNQAPPVVNNYTYNVSPGGRNVERNTGIGNYGLSPRQLGTPSSPNFHSMNSGGSGFSGGVRGSQGSPLIMGGLGAIDDLKMGSMAGSSPFSAPVVDAGQVYGGSLFGQQPGTEMMDASQPAEVEFPVTDAPLPDQGIIIAYKGLVQGIGHAELTDDPLNAALGQMIIQARNMGANGIVSLTLNEAGGKLMASGQAVQIG